MANRGLAIASLTLAVVLAACQPGSGDDIVGRWEFGDQDFGLAYEFNEDGTGALFNSLDPFSPSVGTFTYTFEADSGVLKASTELGPTTRTMIFLVSFETKDSVLIEQSGASKPFPCVRKPLPKLPPEARARLGGMLLGKDFVFVDAEEAVSGWQERYENYTAIARTDLEMTVGGDLEEWLVTLKLEGEEENRVYVLSKGEGRWGVIELVANE